MGYLEKALGDNERILYRTHRHVIVLLGQIVGWLFLFIVLLGLGLAVLLPKLDDAGTQVRHIVGLIVLCALVIPVVWIARALLRGERGRGLLKAIWLAVLAILASLAWGLILIFHPMWWQIGWVGVILALYPLANLVRIILNWMNERYVITTRRVMEVKGIINKHVRDSALEKVNDVELDQSFLGRILNWGTVEIITGSDIGVNEFHRISSPLRFKREMLNAKEQLHVTAPAIEAETWAAASTPPAAASSTASGTPAPDAQRITELIADLDALRQKGVLTEEEFQAKKKDLLARL